MFASSSMRESDKTEEQQPQRYERYGCFQKDIDFRRPITEFYVTYNDNIQPKAIIEQS